MIVTSTSDALLRRNRRTSRRAHSKPVNPLPTITTDAIGTTVVVGPRGLRAGEQCAEFCCQPGFTAAGTKLAPKNLRQLRDAPVADEQESHRIGGDDTVSALPGRTDHAGGVVDRDPITGPAPQAQLEAD